MRDAGMREWAFVDRQPFTVNRSPRLARWHSSPDTHTIRARVVAAKPRSVRSHMLDVDSAQRPSALGAPLPPDGWLPLEDVIITSQLSRRTPRDRDLHA